MHEVEEGLAMSSIAALEICVDTLSGVETARRGGAQRVELCSSLSEGGLTPSWGLMRAAAHLPIPCYAMIRPRAGLFAFSEAEIAFMIDDVTAARQAGLAGVVLGVQNATGDLDRPSLQRLIDAAGPMGTTRHRVIDVVPDPLRALGTAMELGFDRVLTSGGAPFAPEGQTLISNMVEMAQGRISIMPGCGLDASNVAGLVRATGVLEVHAACHLPAPGDRAFSDFDPPGGRFETSEHEVREMVQALQG